VLLLLASRGWYTRGYRAAVGRLVLPRCCLCVYEIGGSIRSIGRSIGGSQMTANQTTSGQFVFFTRPPRGNLPCKPDHLGAMLRHTAADCCGRQTDDRETARWVVGVVGSLGGGADACTIRKRDDEMKR
jgi:hypothetical protein